MSITPDQGMPALYADMARRNQHAAAMAASAAAGAPAQGEVPGDGGGAGLDVMAQLSVALGSNTDEMRRTRESLVIPWEVCHPAPLNPVAIPGAGTLNDERWEPRPGWCWHVTRVSVQSALTGGATSAILAQDSGAAAGAYNLQSFPPVGTTAVAGAFLGCWEPKGYFMMPGDRLILITTGGGAIMNGSVVEIALAWLSRYLM